MAKKILVTEDSATVLEMLKAAITAEGYDVITASDGQEALKKARNESPDLVILDLMLPKMDGYRVCAMLKYDSRYSKIPVIMFTERAQEADVLMGKEVKADAYLSKSSDTKKLIDKIKEILK